MKTTLELPDQLVEEIKLRASHEGQELTVAVVALLRKGLAADSEEVAIGVEASAAMLQRRKEIADKFISGQWGVELDGIEAGQAADRESERELEGRWRT